MNKGLDRLVREVGLRLKDEFETYSKVIPIELGWKLKELRRAENARLRPPAMPPRVK